MNSKSLTLIVIFMMALHTISAITPRKRTILEKNTRGSFKTNNLDYEKSPECKEILKISFFIN